MPGSVVVGPPAHVSPDEARFSRMFELPPPYVEFASPAEAHAWGLTQLPSHSRRATYEVEALARYKGHCHKVVNAHLRDDRGAQRRNLRSKLLRSYFRDGMEDDIQVLRDAMAAAAIDRPVVAWRGFNSPSTAAFVLANVGQDTFVDKAFVSTSLDAIFANEYAMRGGPGAVVLTMLVPRGAQAIYMEDLAGPHHGNRETELLLLDRAAFQILHAEADGDGVTRAVVKLMDARSRPNLRGV